MSRRELREYTLEIITVVAIVIAAAMLATYIVQELLPR